MNPILLAPILASFLTTLLLMPFWIRKAKQIGIVWEDMNKYHSEKVAGSGGTIAVLGFIIGVLTYIAYRIFIVQTQLYLVEILSLLTVILLATGIGLADDLFGWRKGGLSKRSRIILLAIASIPLIVINAGKSQISLPLLGRIDIGLLYPLLFIPIGIIGATFTFNFLAGFNGLEAGQGVILLSSLAAVSFFMGNTWLSITALCMAASLFAFLIFNFYPAEVFPGNSLTYATGGLIAILAILGDFEKVAVFFFTPYIIETILKSRGKLIKQSFGAPQKDNTLDLRYDKLYGLEHLAIFLLKKANIAPTEKRVVYSIWLFQIFIIILGFIIFREGIFIGN